MNIPKSLVNDVKRHGYEVAPGGIHVPKANVFVGGVFDYEVLRAGDVVAKYQSRNLVVNEGLNHILEVVLGATSKDTEWYVGLFENNYTPVAGDTMALFPGGGYAGECTAYAEATRQAYVQAAASSQSITNSANKASFTINATKTIYGAFLSNSSQKGGVTGKLLAADSGATAKSVVNNDILMVAYTLTLTAS